MDLPILAVCIYGTECVICFYFRNIQDSYSKISYIRKKELRCKKGKQMEIPFLFWIQFEFIYVGRLFVPVAGQQSMACQRGAFTL